MLPKNYIRAKSHPLRSLPLHSARGSPTIREGKCLSKTPALFVVNGSLRDQRIVDALSDLWIVEIARNAVTVFSLVAHVNLVLDRWIRRIEGEIAGSQWVE